MWHALLGPFLLRVTRAASTDDLFIVPTAPGPQLNYVANFVWSLDSVQNIQWTTTLDSYFIALYQQSLNVTSAKQIETIFSPCSTMHCSEIGLTLCLATNKNGKGSQSFKWPVQIYDSNLTFSDVYFLWLNPNLPGGFTSHYINITEKQTLSSTSSSSSSAPSTSISITSITTVTPSSNTAATATEPTPKTDATALKVGLGVGIGAGLPLVLIAGIWIGLKVVRQRKSSAIRLDDLSPPAYLSKPFHHAGEPIYPTHEIHEAPAEIRSPAELG